jgi:hypothetical protein
MIMCTLCSAESSTVFEPDIKMNNLMRCNCSKYYRRYAAFLLTGNIHSTKLSPLTRLFRCIAPIVW